MSDGVAMLDPARVYIDAGVDVAPGVRLYPDVYLEGATDGRRRGRDRARGSRYGIRPIGAGASVRYSVVQGAPIGAEANVGPFTYLRPGADLGTRRQGRQLRRDQELAGGPRIEGARISPTSVTPRSVRSPTSVPARSRRTTTVSRSTAPRSATGSRIGSDTMLVAPVTIGDDAYTGAGSVISEDVPPGSLAIERSHQKEIPGYAERRTASPGGPDLMELPEPQAIDGLLRLRQRAARRGGRQHPRRRTRWCGTVGLRQRRDLHPLHRERSRVPTASFCRATRIRSTSTSWSS